VKELGHNIIECLRRELLQKRAHEPLPEVLGGGTVAGGLWRFFTAEDAAKWNSPALWRGAWPFLLPELFFFGEDLWGNQLTLRPGSENVWLWNHENGELEDLLLDPTTLLEAVIQSGLDWIDFYSPHLLAVGRAKLLDVPENCHLHWVQPLIMGGAINVTNTSAVESAMHLRGHGKLWTQLRELPPGTEVAIKPKT
jgi:hypothetical protein